MEIFLVLVIVWLSAGFYSGEVAHQKGYSGAAWAIGGFFFGFIALIAAAGLPDRKLRKYIRLIGEKQNAIEVVKETVEQLQKQKKYSESELIALKQLLNKTFRTIKKNDQFIAIKLLDKGIFYFKNEKVLETSDMDFLDLFFNIWLRENSQDPDFTKSLLGKNN